MRRAAVAVLLAACSTSPARPPALSGQPRDDTLTLPPARRVVHLARTQVEDISTIIETTHAGQPIHVGARRHHVTASEVLAVDAAGAVTKLAVTYVERDDVTSTSAGDENRPSAIAGRSYIVWIEGGEVQATQADGGAVSSEELLELTLDQGDLGKPVAMDTIMARAWTRGAKVDLTADELSRYNDGRDGPRATAMSFTLRGVAGGVADFAAIMRMETDAPPLVIEAQGTLTVDVETGRPRGFALTGSVRGTANGVALGGTTTSSITYAFVEP